MAQDLKGLYQARCAAAQVPPNPAVLAKLGSSALKELDASGARIGDQGLPPVLAVVEAAGQLEQLSLASSDLGTPSVDAIVRVLSAHPSMRTVDLSHNQFPLGGESLHELVKANSRITELQLTETGVRPLFIKLIDYQVKKNAKGGGARGGYSGAAPAAGAKTVSIAPAPPAAAPASGSPHGSPGVDYGNAFGGFNFGGGDAAPDDGWSAGEASEGTEAADEDRSPRQQEVEMDEAAEQEAARRQQQAAAGGARRKTVSSEVISMRDIQGFHARVVEKAPADTEWLLSQLEPVHLFAHLEDNELRTAVDAMTQVENMSRGDVLVDDGAEGNRFFIIQQGTAEEHREGRLVRTLRAGDHVCETDLMYPSPHETSVSVTSDGFKAWALDRMTYRSIATQSAQQKRERYMGFLKTVHFLKGCTEKELMQLADALKSTKYTQGQTIIAYGSEGSWFHIITEGVVDVIGRDDAGQEKHVCTFTVGECVGELEFINKHKCVADVKAKTPEVKSAKMSRSHFIKVMGPALDVLKRVADTSDVYQYYRQTQQKSD